MSSRARPLPPDERRAALVAATLPLISEHGPDVSTRQIACAAGVAEGTIYRAFPDKESLIQASLAAAFDPTPVVRRLASLDPGADFEERVTAAVEILQNRLSEVFHLISAFGLHGPPQDKPGHPGLSSNAAILESLTEVFARDAVRLRLEPAQCARLMRLIVFAGSHPRITDHDPLSTREIVDLLLHGIAKPDAAPRIRPPTTHRSLTLLIRLLRTYLRPYHALLAAVVGLQLVGTMASLYLPSLNADIIDNGVTTGNTAYIIHTGGLMLLVSLMQIICSIAAVYYGAKAAMSFGRDARAAVFRRVGEFSAREVAQFGAPSLITRNTNDVQQVQMLVVMSCTMLVAAPITCVGGIIMALRQDVGLAWLMVVAVPALAISVGLIVSRMVPGFRAMQKRIDAVNRVLREQITGIRVVRAFVREDRETERFAEANTAVTASALYVGRLMILIFPVVMLIMNGSSVAVLWFGGHRVASGQMQVGALTAFLSYLVMILMSVMMATFVAMMVPRAAVCAERISEVLDTESSVRPPTAPVRQVTGRGHLELRNVTFSYPGAESAVLRDISLEVRPGETTAIIGSTGAGKTTLMSLIPRLVDVTGGELLVDGVDVRQLDPEVLWTRIGLVPQRPYLFGGTVASNLRYGNPDASDEQLWLALDVAQGRDFVEAMPDGLDSPIAQGGTNVSGGQRQRLCIARALVADPEIYLFDDSFSALDLTTDARLRAALRPHTANAAVVIVAQRVSTITDADQIIVLEDGEVVGRGNHEDLLLSCPTYAEIVESQLAVEEAA